jgi:hypothetical protein
MSYLKRRINRLERGLNRRKKKQASIIFVQENQDGRSYYYEGKNFPDIESLENEVEAVSYVIIPKRNEQKGN